MFHAVELGCFVQGERWKIWTIPRFGHEIGWMEAPFKEWREMVKSTLGGVRKASWTPGIGSWKADGREGRSQQQKNHLIVLHHFANHQPRSDSI